MTRLLRALAGLGAMFVLGVAASGCVGSTPAPAPTPDPFAGLAERSDQAFRQGLEAYGQGQYRTALNSFEQAKTLSPTADERLDAMIQRTKDAMAPTPTAVPPTATTVPASPTPAPTPVAMSKEAADTDLGQRYFGKVSLVTVPGNATDAPVGATQFFYQDQLGLRLEGLKQHARLPFSLRVFNTDTQRLVAQVSSDDAAAGPTSASGSAKPTDVAAPRTAAASASGATAASAATAASRPTADAAASPAPDPTKDFKVVRFFDTYVWYQKGGDAPGRYHLELYANGILTNTIDYTVGTVPVPTPTPSLEPTAAVFNNVPTLEPLPQPQIPAPVPAAPKPAPAAPAVAPVPPTPTLQPTPIPSPTPLPTPATASGTTIGGLPAGLDVNPNNGRVFIADGSGVVWANDPSRPAAFNRPINLGNLPTDVAVDANTGYVFIAARNNSAVVVLDQSGRRLSDVALPVAPSDLAIDSDRGLLYVVLPQSQALGVIDARAGRLLRTVDGMPQVTSLALDPTRHTLYASHLGGQVSVIDVPSSQVTARITLTGVGLESVATARGLAYAINTASHELAVVEPASQNVTRYVLPAEPAAVAASEDSGSIYVLGSQPNTLLRIDPTDGTIVGQVSLPDRGGRFGISAGDPTFQGLRSRMVLNRADESLYLTLPESGSLSIVPNNLFPPLNRDIPWVQVPEDAPVVASIPGVIRPAAAPLPSQPAPSNVIRAEAPAAPTTPDEEAN